ncbi:sensor domain-containing diguanylate cyclase [Jeotgalibacillus marinus]|uniref:Diguanylate cyclase n=1 Tax=Jeotgalibacillus marinus TaxID=86667 RepID=A0ABV3Q045_9BACL
MKLQRLTDRFKAGVFDILSDSMTGQASVRSWYRQISKLFVNEFQVEKVQYFCVEEHQLHVYEQSEKVIVQGGESLIKQLKHQPFIRISITNGSVKAGDVLIPCYDHGNLLGVFCLRPSEQAEWFKVDPFVNEISKNLTVLFQNVMQMTSTSKEKKHYHELFEVTEVFNSIMDVNEILATIIESLRKTFPLFSFALYLSDDHENESDLPIKHLDYPSNNPFIHKAFVTSEVLLDEGAQAATLWAPLKGKQGVYGLLQVEANSLKTFPENDKEFIKNLSYTAGNALENAKLYQQSQKLIEDLQLINDLSHELNSNLNLSDMMRYLFEQITSAFSPSAIGFVLLQGDNMDILDDSSAFFKTQESELYLSITIEQFKEGEEALYITDLSAKINQETAYQSLVAVPMVHDEQLRGFCIVLHEEPYFFTFEMYKLLQLIVHHSTLAVGNSMLREELQEMINKDHLTDLFARNYLDQYIEQSMSDHDEGVFVLIDIDNFKRVNDTYGHQIGDEVIIQLADELKGLTANNGIGARWGGEELALYFPNTPIEIGLKTTEKLLNRVSKHTNPTITISCGITNWQRQQKDSLIKLVKRADEALYTAKKNGKNRIAYRWYEAIEWNA